MKSKYEYWLHIYVACENNFAWQWLIFCQFYFMANLKANSKRKLFKKVILSTYQILHKTVKLIIKMLKDFRKVF